MKVAVVGTREFEIDVMEAYVPGAATEIISGGAKGVDSAAKEFAEERDLKYTEFLPDYEKYGKAAPIKRNDEIIAAADMVVALWDGRSHGTKYVIDTCRKIKKSMVVYYLSKETGYLEIKSRVYSDMESLDTEVLKGIIISELDKKYADIINVDLIDAAVEAILEKKHIGFAEMLEVVKQEAIEKAKKAKKAKE